mgnify:CR=1 FL=1
MNNNFIDDEEKMRDFKLLTKTEFLNFYTYLSEEEYNNTYELLKGKKTKKNIITEDVKIWK